MPNCSICGTPHSQWEVRGDIASCPVCDVALIPISSYPLLYSDEWIKFKKALELKCGSYKNDKYLDNGEKLLRQIRKQNEEFRKEELEEEFQRMRVEAEAQVQQQMDEIKRKLDGEKE